MSETQRNFLWQLCLAKLASVSEGIVQYLTVDIFIYTKLKAVFP